MADDAALDGVVRSVGRGVCPCDERPAVRPVHRLPAFGGRHDLSWYADAGLFVVSYLLLYRKGVRRGTDRPLCAGALHSHSAPVLAGLSPGGTASLCPCAVPFVDAGVERGGGVCIIKTASDPEFRIGGCHLPSPRGEGENPANCMCKCSTAKPFTSIMFELNSI